MTIVVTRWRQEGACRGQEQALFFAPDTGEPRDQRRAREAAAKRICLACAVRDDCLENSLVHREPHGIWGGLTESERRSLLRTAELASSG